jgi:V/A-type H+-transporting ATPase subunit C
MYELDIYNLKIILKKIFFKLDNKHIEQYLLFEGRHLTKSIIEKLMKLDSFKSFSAAINNTPYSKVFSDIKEEDNDPFIRCEVMLAEFLLKKSIILFRSDPLTVDIVLGYLFAKEIEVKNIRTIIKSKVLELKENYVNKLIIR